MAQMEAYVCEICAPPDAPFGTRADLANGADRRATPIKSWEQGVFLRNLRAMTGKEFASVRDSRNPS